MMTLPEWVQVGQQYLRAYMTDLLEEMCEAEPSPSQEQWDELWRYMTLFHDLRTAAGSKGSPTARLPTLGPKQASPCRSRTPRRRCRSLSRGYSSTPLSGSSGVA